MNVPENLLNFWTWNGLTLCQVSGKLSRCNFLKYFLCYKGMYSKIIGSLCPIRSKVKTRVNQFIGTFRIIWN